MSAMEELDAAGKEEVTKKLARAVLGFQDSYLARENSPIGLLCQVRMQSLRCYWESSAGCTRFFVPRCILSRDLQVWLPEESAEGKLELKTKVILLSLISRHFFCPGESVAWFFLQKNAASRLTVLSSALRSTAGTSLLCGRHGGSARALPLHLLPL